MKMMHGPINIRLFIKVWISDELPFEHGGQIKRKKSAQAALQTIPIFCTGVSLVTIPLPVAPTLWR